MPARVRVRNLVKGKPAEGGGGELKARQGAHLERGDLVGGHESRHEGHHGAAEEERFHLHARQIGSTDLLQGAAEERFHLHARQRRFNGSISGGGRGGALPPSTQDGSTDVSKGG